MAENWQDYQNEAAEFFRSLGLDAKVDYRVEGARGTHAVDVWVTFQQFGLEVKWIIECKFWGSAIPKEKVLALQQIVQDVGADRAFLLSEVGFQSGAIKVANNTNVTLTSLEDLRENAQEDIFNAALISSNKLIASLEDRVKPLIFDEAGNIYRRPWVDLDEALSGLGTILFLKLSVQKASIRKFPIHIFTISNENKVSENPREFIEVMTSALTALEEKIEDLENLALETLEPCKEAVANMIAAVQQLMVTAEAALFGSHEDEQHFMEARLQALEAMKAVGRRNQELKPIAKGAIRAKLSSLMQLLINTVYLYLTKDTIPINEWERTKEAVRQELKSLTESVLTPVVNIGVNTA